MYNLLKTSGRALPLFLFGSFTFPFLCKGKIVKFAHAGGNAPLLKTLLNKLHIKGNNVIIP